LYEIDGRFGSIEEELLFFSPEATSITAGLFCRICNGFVAMTERQVAKGMRGLSAVVLSRLFQPKVRDYETHGERGAITWILLVYKVLSPRPSISSSLPHLSTLLFFLHLSYFLQLLDGRPAFSSTEGTAFWTLEDYAGLHVALVDKESLASRGFWRRVLDTSGDGMVPLRELFESVMASFKEKNWELITFEDFLQDARDRLSCDDGADARGGIPWERIMAPTNGRHAAVILDCLVSANRFGQHEQEPQLAWRARGEGDPTAWAAYVAEKIRRGAETSNRASKDGDAQGGDKGWGQGGEEMGCGEELPRTT